MPSLTATAKADAPLSKLWATWDDFANIYLFNPNIRASYTINETGPTGVGAERQCDLNNGRDFLRERIAVYRPEERLEIDIFESSMPMASMRALFEFKSVAPAQSTVTMTLHYVPKFGVFGLLMTAPMRPLFRKQLKALVEASARNAETGATANPERPSAAAE